LKRVANDEARFVGDGGGEEVEMGAKAGQHRKFQV
jgi:hypothetical protein